MNKQNRGDYGNAENTVPTVPSIPNTPIKATERGNPGFKSTPHPFKRKKL